MYGLIVAGTRLLDPDRWSVGYYQTAAGENAAVVTRKDTGKKSLVSLKGNMSSLMAVSGLENLTDLTVAVQCLTNVSAGQLLQNLKKVTLISCDNLRSIKPLLKLPELEEIGIFHCGVQDIDNIESLEKLTRLELTGTHVTDLSPLAGCDFSYAESRGGFAFRCFDHQVTDFSTLRSIPSFSELGIEDGTNILWTDYVKGKKIRALHVKNWRKQLTFNAVTANHPELETLTLENCTQLTNLNALCEMPNLKDVYLTEDMQSLGEKLEGYTFTLHIAKTTSVTKEAWVDGDPDMLEVVHEGEEGSYY